MQRSYPKNPLLQRVKGVFVFKSELPDCVQQSSGLLKTLQCEVLSSHNNRITISTSRGNLQNIKQCWLSNDPGNDLSRQLNQQVSQIIIGGNLYEGNS
jgi:hypothetical protein